MDQLHALRPRIAMHRGSRFKVVPNIHNSPKLRRDVEVIPTNAVLHTSLDGLASGLSAPRSPPVTASGRTDTEVTRRVRDTEVTRSAPRRSEARSCGSDGDDVYKSRLRSR